MNMESAVAAARKQQYMEEYVFWEKILWGNAVDANGHMNLSGYCQKDKLSSVYIILLYLNIFMSYIFTVHNLYDTINLIYL